MPKPLSKEMMNSLTFWQSVGLKIAFSEDPFGLTSNQEFSKKLLQVEFDGTKMQLNIYRLDPYDEKPINQDAYKIQPDGSLIPIPKKENSEHHLPDYPERIKQALRNKEVLNQK